MRVLVTSGNTVVPIDKVRCISNVFRGHTGINIALEAYSRGHNVHLMASDPILVQLLESDPSPPSSGSDRPRMADRWKMQLTLGLQLAKAIGTPRTADRWKVEPYLTFDDLHDAMHRVIHDGTVDVVIHSAAVSDYRVEGVFAPDADTRFLLESQTWENRGGTTPRLVDRGSGKVRSSEPELWLRMVQNPKLVDLVRLSWHFTGILVKFKLEVGVDERQLLEIAELSRNHSDADLVVANTLAGLTFLGPVEGTYERVSRGQLPSRLVDAIETLHKKQIGSTPTKGSPPVEH